MSPSAFRLLGRFGAEVDRHPVPDAALGNRKARLLLKVLAARRGGHVSMDALIEALWPDAPPDRAVENVATLVSRLRSALGTESIEGGRSGYRLAIPAGCRVDVDDAARLVEEAEHRLRAGQPALAVTAVSQALELLEAGRPMEDEAGGEWLEELRREVAGLLRRARAAGWTAATAAGEHRRALAIAERAVAADGLDEEAHRAVITAYYRLGEPGEALAAYERCRTVLVDELGADPGPETQTLYLAVLRGEPLSDRERPTAVSGPAGGVVGRDAELAQLMDCWEAAVRGHPSQIVIVGEAGIGKTRLVEALVEQVRASGGVAVQARCYESEQSLFIQPLVEVLRELIATVPAETVIDAAGSWAGLLANLVPELTRLVGPVSYERASAEMERRRTFEAVASFVCTISQRRPLLVFLDDAHNAGPSTLELAHFASRWDRSAQLLIALTVQGDRESEVVAHLGDRLARIRLGPLTEGAVTQLAGLAGHPELGAELWRLTKGHTLFVIEGLRAATDDEAGLRVPESLRDAVATRIARCGPGVDEFLRGAVVAGSLFDVAHVAELLGISDEDAARRAELALRAGLLTESPGGYEFANDVIRTVLYETTPAPTRIVRHRRLAALLSARPEVAAEHAAAAGDRERAVDLWLDAADHSLGAFANSEAERLLSRALDTCVLLGDPARTALVRLRRGRAQLNQAHYQAAADDLAAALALARALGDSELEASALESLAWCAYYGRQVERARELAERALGHPAAGPGALVLAGRLRSAQGELAGAIESLEKVSLAPGVESAVRAAALSYLGTALAHSDRYSHALVVLTDAVASCEVTGALRPMFNALFFSALTRANLGDLAGALETAARLDDNVERYSYAAYRARSLNLQSWLWRELGDPPRALDLGRAALEATVLPDGYVEAEPAAHARLQMAESALLTGDEASAAGWLAELAGAVLTGVAFGWRVELHRLDLAARLEPARCEELFEAARTWGSVKYQALALALLGRGDEAVRLAATTSSELLVARVAPEAQATEAAQRVAAQLASDQRSQFLKRGAWQREQRLRPSPRRRR